MEAYLIGACGILIGFAVGWLSRSKGQRRGRGRKVQDIPRTGCHMCGRVQRSENYTLWKIRGNEMHVCGRCHPFFKERFEREDRDDADTVTGELHQVSA